MNVKRFVSSHAYCIFCTEKRNLKNIPMKERQRSLSSAKIYIPKDARVCPAHLAFNNWEQVSDQVVLTNAFTAHQIEDMMELKLHQNHVDRESSIDIHRYTGLTDDQFENLFSSIPSLITTLRSPEKAKNALLMLLIRFRMAYNYTQTGNLFGMTNKTSHVHINHARDALLENFVPLHLGFDNLSRQFLLNNTTISARLLHGENNPAKLITIWDGTYIYIDKSANHEFQKKTYNGQKKRNFLRPMVCVTTNGQIVDVFGPFAAVDNDAKCMKHIIENVPAVTETVNVGDVFIFDRGFRDCLADFEQKQYVVKMPSFVRSKERYPQLTTEQANCTRLVTKTRFVVETRNGHIKSVFPVFDRRWGTLAIKDLGKDLRIAAALINKYFAKVVADEGNQEYIANAMLAAINSPNIVHSIVSEAIKYEQYKYFVPIEEEFFFPQIAREELLKITLGKYQMKQARSYTVTHTKNGDGEFVCHFFPVERLEECFGEIIREKNIIKPVLVSARFASRHFSAKSYDVFILADASKNDKSAIIGYCCDCICGLRTLGCCSHVATLLYYLCIARHTGRVQSVAGHVDDFFRQIYDVQEEGEEEGEQGEEGEDYSDEEYEEEEEEVGEEEE